MPLETLHAERVSVFENSGLAQFTSSRRLAHEGPCILHWALAGWKRLQARGRFAAPAGVLDASDRFQHDNDLMAQFIAEHAHGQKDGRVQSSELYSAYQDWCTRNGHHPLSGERAAANWERLGFERKRIEGRSFWCGLALNPPLSQADDEYNRDDGESEE